MNTFQLFVYGSLMKNHWNHHYCHHAESIELATVCGRIYRRRAGYPAFLVPAEHILAKGTNSPTQDVRTQYDRTLDPVEFHTPAGWYEVHGELVTFDNPDFIIPIDRLEGTPRYYERVLLPVRNANNEVTAAWGYVMYRVPAGSVLMKSGHWPE